MIELREFCEAMTNRGVRFFTGVPDSLLADLCAYVEDNIGLDKHVIAANEGNAVGIAIGFHMATSDVAMVYMQNSGLGNAVNPLVSLADPEVFKVPMILVIGWRGEPGIKDEPQHVKQGRVTIPQLEILDIPHWVLDSNSNYTDVLDNAFKSMKLRNAPVALVIRKDTFTKYKKDNSKLNDSKLAREQALEQLLELIPENDLIISTTGKTSRELYELRVRSGGSENDFLTVGGMGHTSSIALGLTIGKPNQRVVCLDGDGSLIMHMGSLAIIGNNRPSNFVHVVLNNGAHESVGGQETSAKNIDFAKLTNAVGYTNYLLAEDTDSLKKAWNEITVIKGPTLLEIKIKCGSRDNLGRPKSTAEENKIKFMNKIRGNS